MAMHIAERGGVTVVRMDSTYSAFNNEKLDDAEDAILAAIEPSSPPRLVLDFSDTEYFSSMFIELLFRVWNRVRKAGGQFVLCGLQPVCREILTTAKLDSIWEIVPTADDAVAACTS